jgi:hypothetical protein
MKKETMAASESTKKKNFLGILFDAVECCLYVPLFGEFSDVIWAPMAAYLMTRMYKEGGKVGGGNFIEEIVPLLILYLLLH